MLGKLVTFFLGCCGVWPSLALFIHTCFMKGNYEDRMKKHESRSEFAQFLGLIHITPKQRFLSENASNVLRSIYYARVF